MPIPFIPVVAGVVGTGAGWFGATKTASAVKPDIHVNGNASLFSASWVVPMLVVGGVMYLAVRKKK